MHITVTSTALQVLRERKPELEAVLRLTAMDEGCGCGASVLFDMNWDTPRTDDHRVQIEPGLVVAMDPHSRSYFAPEVTIDVTDDNRFVLKSSNQIFLSHIQI